MPIIAAHNLGPKDGTPQIYNGFDCGGTIEVLPKLLSVGGANADLMYGFYRGLQGAVLEMTLRGFRVDPLAREWAINDLGTRVRAVHQFLNEIVAPIWQKEINYRSGDQIKELLYEFLGIPPVVRYVKQQRKEPMDADALGKLGQRHPEIAPITQAVLTCRDLDKQKRTFESEVDVDSDGEMRMRYSLNIAGTNEGRFSSSKSTLGTGMNMQNVDPRLRYMFIADQGWKLCGIDKEQAESRWVGFTCGILFNDWSYLDACESGDSHTAVARMVWANELPWTGDIKKDRLIAEQPFGFDTYRQACKILAHATNLMGKPETLSMHTKVPKHLVEQFQNRYFRAFPCIPRYHTWIANKIQSSQFLVNHFGMRRDFFDRPESEETWKAAAAFMQASPNACDIKLGMWRVWKHMGLRVRLCTEEHDAIYFQFQETDDELDVVRTAQDHLKVEFDLGFRKFSVPTDAKTGWNKGARWERDESGNIIDKNPRGLDKPGARR